MNAMLQPNTKKKKKKNLSNTGQGNSKQTILYVQPYIEMNKNKKGNAIKRSCQMTC